MNARGSPRPSRTYIAVTVSHAARHSTAKHTAGQAVAPNPTAVRHEPPSPPKPSAIGYRRNHRSRPKVRNVGVAAVPEVSEDAVVVPVSVRTVVPSGEVCSGWHRQ